VRDANQGVLREAMLHTYTRHAAQAFDQQGRIRSIASGEQPALVLLDRDELPVTAEEARHTKVLWTVVDEKHGVWCSAKN
jgi:predicted amidohydrolase YtcJ